MEQSVRELTEVEQVKERKQRIVRIVFAVLCIALAYRFIGIIPINEVPLATLLFAIVLFGVTLCFGLAEGVRIRADAVIAMILGIVFSSFFFLSGVSLDGIGNTYYPCFLLTLMAYAYFVYCLFGNRKGKLPGAEMLLEWLQALILYPFESFPALFITIFSAPRTVHRRNWKPVVFTLIGIVLALLLGFGVIMLLSFDVHFAAAVDVIVNLFTFDTDLLFEILFKLLFAIPLGALLFGMNTSARQKRHPQLASESTVRTISAKTRFLPVVVAALPAVVLIIIYGLFFFSQMPYYVSAFSGVLPEGYSTAEYARNGFFELCGIAAINAVLVLVLKLIAKRGGRFADVVQRILIVVLSVETLILIATALSKMFLYIKRFDLTLTRLWPTFFLFFLAIGFFTLLVSVFWAKAKALPVLMICGILFAALYPFCNVNGQVAKYNVDSYFRKAAVQSETASIDVEYLFELGEAAVPQIQRLYESEQTDADTREQVELAVLNRPLERWDPIREIDDEPTHWYQYSLHTAKALEILHTLKGSLD